LYGLDTGIVGPAADAACRHAPQRRVIPVLLEKERLQTLRVVA
jgi:hypothetical protein